MRACAACESISSNPSLQSDCVRTFISRCCSKAGENGTHACISCIYSKACTCIKLRTHKMNTAHCVCVCVRGVYIGGGGWAQRRLKGVARQNNLIKLKLILSPLDAETTACSRNIHLPPQNSQTHTYNTSSCASLHGELVFYSGDSARHCTFIPFFFKGGDKIVCQK